jgi:hypothetical protein
VVLPEIAGVCGGVEPSVEAGEAREGGWSFALLACGEVKRGEGS